MSSFGRKKLHWHVEILFNFVWKIITMPQFFIELCLALSFRAEILLEQEWAETQFMGSRSKTSFTLGYD